MSQYEEIEKQLKEAELKDTADGNLNLKNNGTKANQKETSTEEGTADSGETPKGETNGAGNSADTGNPANGSNQSESGSSTSSDSGASETTEPSEKPWYESDSEDQSVPETTTVLTAASEEEEDEEIKLFKEYKKSGKTLKEFVKEFDLTDYNALSDAEIIQRGLKELENFEGDEYESAVEEVAQMSLFQKKKLIQDRKSTRLNSSH